MNQDNGGIIGKINTPTTTVASGIWSLDSQFDSQSSSIWPLAFPNTTIANSCRFDDGSSDYLTFTPSGNGNRKVFTISLWVKRGNLGIQTEMIGSSDSGFGNGLFLEFTSSDTLRFGFQDPNVFKITTRVFRDTLAWYHICVAIDVTQSSNSDRVKIYINGIQETSFSTDDTMANEDRDWNNTQAHSVGRSGAYNGLYFDGYLAEVVNVDGQQLLPTSFGAFNPATNIWEPVAYAGTYGTNGFRLDFADSSALGNDVSGNDNDFTVNNLTSIDQSSDTCSNNFASINSSYYAASSYTLTNGNLAVDGNASNAWRSLYGTFGLTSGKWYWEIKIDAINSGDANNFAIGVVSSDQVDQSSSNGKFFGTAQGYAYHGKDGKKLNNDTVTANGASYGDSFTTGDIVGVFLDLDNHKLYFSKNGTVQASGDPTSGSTGTNAAFSITTGHTYFPAIANYYSAEHYSFNYGSPPFTISSGNADSNSYGNFEYPTQGYYTCNTKNLAEFGG